MKFLHTADWHLGRIFHQIHLTEDQAHALDQIVEIARAERVDVVLVAGDIYDRAVPPPEAVALLDKTWKRFALELSVPVIAMPGNHDSATRIGYGAALLSRAGLHLVADFDTATRPISVGDVDVFALPFTEPAEVRAWSGNAEVRDHASALRVCIERMRANFQPGRPRILLCHAFVAGQLRESESERPISVGGAGTVPHELFKDFDYVALGHLHALQEVSARCLYSGSPLKYSFSEADDLKSVVVGEITATGELISRVVPLNPRRNVRNLEGTLADLITSAPTDPHRGDYLRIILTDDGALLNALGRLREAYPNVLQIERRFLRRDAASGTGTASARRRESTETDLFSSFFRDVVGNAPSDAELTVFHQTIAELQRAESETVETEV
ncbi:MAG: exonuclease SbcCD subunit D [Opitutus sp.]